MSHRDTGRVVPAPLFLLLALGTLLALPAAADEISDAYSGVSVEPPEGWEHRSEEETGETRISLVHSPDEPRRAEFNLASTIDADFGVEDWVTRKRNFCEKWFDDVTGEFRVDEGSIDGYRTTRCTMSGTKEGEPARRCIQLVVRGDRVLQFSLTTFNGAGREPFPGWLENLWEAVRIREPEVTVSVPPDVGKPWVIEDDPAACHLTVPGHFDVDYRPPEDPEAELRSKVSRRDDMGQVCMWVYVLRFEAKDDEAFTSDATPYIAKKFVSGRVYFSNFFGDDSGSRLEPRLERGRPFGGVRPGQAFEFRSLTMRELEDRREAERRGEEFPDLPETVMRCRAATVSPYVYILAAWFRPDLADDPLLVEEFMSIARSFEITEKKPLPLPLRVGDERVGITAGNPDFAEPREVETLCELTGRKVYRLGVRYVVPEAFERRMVDGNTSIRLCAQDKDHNWMQILVWHGNHLSSSDRDKELVDWRVTCNGWREYWLGKAPDARVPEKPQRVRLSRSLRGRGYKQLTGDVGGWPGTLTVMTFDKSNWRTYIAIETRGRGDRVFASGLAEFLKHLQFDYDVE
jgi:hypothetical protein